MIFDWTISVGTVVSILIVVSAVFVAVSRFDTGLQLALAQIKASVDLLAARVHVMEEWARGHEEGGNERGSRIIEHSVMLGELKAMTHIMDRRLIRLEDKDLPYVPAVKPA